jgi:hydrogenase maturation protein HypF
VTRAPKAASRRPGRAAKVVVFGVVQGVGFRPYIFRLARRMGLRGWVKNAGHGVEIHVESPDPGDVRRFVPALEANLPPLARIEKIGVEAAPFRSFRGFSIRKTRDTGGFVFISPDIATCEECLAEIRDPAERRFHYPFTNCTNCGPRYTIVKDLPYDRGRTTMAGFPMCAECRREYEDPMDRRHHAQPIACPVCGPRVSLIDSRTGRTLPGGIHEAAALIRCGRILAVKGLGGFHLVCDPFNRSAVARLRRLKARERKPLALMAASLAVVERLAEVGPVERELLVSPRRPIVLLKKKREIAGIAPHLDEVGIMLPYTPLHHLLLAEIDLIVATSSNAKDAPIMKDETEGVRRLADRILTHDRPIAMRADDSVVRAASGQPLFVRRARGYVPHPQALPKGLPADRSIVALGGELKVTISVTKAGYVVTSQFLGDLDDYRNFGYFQETLTHLLRLFKVRPEAVVTDLQPDFRTTRYAEGMGIPHLRVQHHYAHILAPLLEHGEAPGKRVLGVAFDGYGYGTDGTPWGGEFLLADYRGFERLARFSPVPMPGGDLAAREPWRMAVAYLAQAFGGALPEIAPVRKIGRAKKAAVLEMIRLGVRSPRTSSCGRLFDAVSFLCGTAPRELQYEAEAAMRLQAVAGKGNERAYPVGLAGGGAKGGSLLDISFAPMFKAILRDLGSGTPASTISARFHETMARLILRVAEEARRRHGAETVVMAGGVFLNARLLERASALLAASGFRVLRPVLYSPSDESLSLGQVAFGLASLGKKRA